MKKRRASRLAAVLTAVIIVLAMIPVTALPVRAGHERNDSNTILGTGRMSNPSDFYMNSTKPWSYVYYGEYNGSPMKYRVLDKATEEFGGYTMLLESDRVLEDDNGRVEVPFDTDSANKGSWANSYLKSYLNGENFYNSNNFNPMEMNAIANSYKAKVMEKDHQHTDKNCQFAPLTGEKIFVLDSVEELRESYGELYNNSWSKTNGNTFWLRSRVWRTDYKVYYTHLIYLHNFTNTITTQAHPVAPAFNVDLSKVVYSSLLSGTIGEDMAEFKLTLTDDNIKCEEYGSADRYGATVIRLYNSLSVLEYPEDFTDRKLAVIITDGEWTDHGWSSGASIKYYVSTDITSWDNQHRVSMGIDLPEGFNENWNIYAVYEMHRSGEKTDYCSVPLKIELPYTVIFRDGQGNILKTEYVKKGQAATAPDDPVREGFIFDGWDTDFSNITSDLTVTAKWKESIKDAKITLSKTAFTYNGEVQKPTVKSVKTSSGLTLKEGTDYTVKWSNESSKNVGKYTVTVTGKDKYGGKASASYRICYKDVPMSHNFHDAVYWASDNGYATGYTGKKAGLFGINDDITRGQVMMFLWRAAGKPEPEGTGKEFTDVPSSNNFYKAIKWGVEQGITGGYTGARAGQFGPNDNCTRGQIAMFLWRFAKQPAPAPGGKTFTDVPESNNFYTAIMWASGEKITSGYSDGTFGVNKTCTRGQCVTFLYRLLK